MERVSAHVLKGTKVLNSYWIRAYRAADKLAAIKEVATFDVNTLVASSSRDQRRREIPAEKTKAQADASAPNLARYDAAITAVQDREDTAKTDLDADPDNRRLAHLHQHEKTQRIRLQGERARVARRDAQLDIELARVQEVSDASTDAEAVTRWGGRFALDGLSLLFEIADGDPEPSGPGWIKLGDDADARAFIAANDSDWNSPEVP